VALSKDRPQTINGQSHYLINTPLTHLATALPDNLGVRQFSARPTAPMDKSIGAAKS